MTPRQRFNRLLESVAIPHLALYLVFGQIVVYLLILTRPEAAAAVPLLPAEVLRGDWWRPFTYAFQPVSYSVFWNFISWMMLYFIGSALEAQWGAARFTLFIVLGWVLTTVVAFLVPGSFATNIFFVHAVFLAFAFIAPNFEMMVMFILPVKAKWLALALWLAYALSFAQGTMGERMSILASVGNFLIFFWRDILEMIRGRGRRAVQAQKARSTAATSLVHTCLVCGKNSQTHPTLDFRYCSKCAGEQCYCPDHIRNHEHVVENQASGS